MAGSLRHIVDENGEFRWDLIENMGDAHEACFEMFQVLARMDPYAVVGALETVHRNMRNGGPDFMMDLPVVGHLYDETA